MSGVCGIVRFDGTPASQESLDAMLSAAPHRAQDGIGRARVGPAAFGYLATEVARKADGPAQPLSDDERNLLLVAHARLDNRAELRRLLTQNGSVRVDSPSDAKLILGAYRHWGSACTERLAGDFAFVIWDFRERHLFASRDPMAMRPLYYHRASDRLLFASEVKQILAVPGVEATIDEETVALFLSGQQGSLSRTYFKGIDQLPPGYSLLATKDAVRTWKYWDPDPNTTIRYKTDEEYAAHFRSLLIDAARVRFQSPKPAGVLLSGGIDSGAVASVAGKLKQEEKLGCPDLYTFSWAFPTLPECDERYLSDQITRRFDFPAIYIDAEEHAPLKTYPELAPDPDEPFFGIYEGIIAAALQQASEHGVGYLFSGHRADLLVGNWNFDYLGLLRSGRWMRLYRELRAHHERFDDSPYDTLRDYFWNPLRRSLWPPERLPRARESARHLWRSLRPATTNGPSLPAWLPQHLRQHVPEDPPTEPIPPGFQRLSRKERYRSVFLPMHMRVATRSERLFARHGIAFSDVWTDRRLVQFVLSVPQHVLCGHGQNKRILYQAMTGVMPESVRKRAAKISPRPLYTRALKTHADLIWDLISPASEAASRGYVRSDALRDQYRAFLDGGEYDYRLWYALTLEMWLRRRKACSLDP